MFDAPMVFGLLAGVPTVAGIVLLVRLVLVTTTVRPNMASWIIWGLVDGSIFLASLSAGVKSSVVIFGIYTLGALTIIALTFKRGKVEFSTFDKLVFSASLIAFALWRITDSPEVAIYINVLVAILSTAPTIRQSWLTPWKEDPVVWMLLALGGLINLFAIAEWTMIHALPAVAVFSLQLLVMITLSVSSAFWLSSRGR